MHSCAPRLSFSTSVPTSIHERVSISGIAWCPMVNDYPSPSPVNGEKAEVQAPVQRPAVAGPGQQRQGGGAGARPTPGRRRPRYRAISSRGGRALIPAGGNFLFARL